MEMKSIAEINFEEMGLYLKRKFAKMSDTVSIQTSSTREENEKSNLNEADYNKGLETKSDEELKLPVKKARKSKKDQSGRDHVCDLCQKSYLSYPALYTHKRNKHNIIPITGKAEIFKNSTCDQKAKFKYNGNVSLKELHEAFAFLTDCYSKIVQEISLNPENYLFKDEFDGIDPFLLQLDKFKSVDLLNIFLPESPDTLNIDTILIIYVILLMKVKQDRNFLRLVTKFMFLLREYLNMIGWDNVRNLQDFGLVNKLDQTRPFCEVSNCEDIPEMLDDFVTVFLEIDPMFATERSGISDLAENFCHWLFVNDMTTYKIFKIDA